MKSWSLLGILLGASLALLLTGCGHNDSEAAQPKAPPPADVGVVTVHSRSVPVVEDFVGRLAATRTADVRARVAGILLKRVYKEGSDVKKNAVLFQIDPAPLEAALHAAQAALAQAQAAAQNARVKAKRYQDLAHKGLISRQDLDDALANERTTAAAVKKAQADVESAKLNLSYATVTAPIGGRAGKAQVTEGALVGQNSPTLLTSIYQIDPIYINFSESFAELEKLRRETAAGEFKQVAPGKVEAQVILPDGTPYPHKGALSFSSVTVDANTGTVSLRATIPNPNHQLLPGMFVKVRLTQGERPNVFVVPQAAVQRDQQGAYVLTVGSADKVARTAVKLGDMRGDGWIITNGLENGDRVIVSGIQHTHPGAKVNPTPADTGEGKTEADSQ